MVKASLNFESGIPIAKVNGGEYGGSVLYLETGETKKGKSKLSLPKGLKMPPRKEAELMMFFQDAYSKGIPPEHLNAPEPLKELYTKMFHSAENSSEVNLPPNSTFSLIPSTDKKQREIWYISGPSGSGKSYIAKGLAQEYHTLYPDRQIYLVSKLEQDATLDKLKYLVRIDPAKLVESPIENLEPLNDSCFYRRDT